jgi:hypothetical protein
MTSPETGDWDEIVGWWLKDIPYYWYPWDSRKTSAPNTWKSCRRVYILDRRYLPSASDPLSTRKPNEGEAVALRGIYKLYSDTNIYSALCWGVTRYFSVCFYSPKVPIHVSGHDIRMNGKKMACSEGWTVRDLYHRNGIQFPSDSDLRKWPRRLVVE